MQIRNNQPMCCLYLFGLKKDRTAEFAILGSQFVMPEKKKSLPFWTSQQFCSFICQVASARREQNELYMRSSSEAAKSRKVPCPRTQQANLPTFFHTNLF